MGEEKEVKGLPEDFEDSEDFEELEDLEVDSIGLVPTGANNRTYILLKGGENMDVVEVAKQIVEDENFWARLAKALGETVEKADDKSKAAAQMAARILGAHEEKYPEAVRKAVKVLMSYAEGKEMAGEEDDEEYPEKKARKPEDEEYPEKKAGKADDEEEPEDKAKRKKDEEDEQYPELSTEGLPESFRVAVEGFRARAERAESLAQSALDQLAAERAERRRLELTEEAERYAALPNVVPSELAENLGRLESADPKLFEYFSTILGASATVVGEVFGEIGTSRGESPGDPFLRRVDAKAKEIQQKEGKPYEEAYAEAYILVGDEDPRAAWAYTNRGH